MFLDISFARITSQAIGIQVSLMQQVDLVAKERNMMRSALITLAVVRQLAGQGGEHLSRIDPLTGCLGRTKFAELQAYIPLS
jgi:hypothetical protein